MEGQCPSVEESNQEDGREWVGGWENILIEEGRGGKYKGTPEGKSGNGISFEM